MTSKPSHTPTPWFQTVSHGNRFVKRAHENDPADICVMVEGEDTENADFIVRCVNAHDRLVAALRDIVDRDLRYYNGLIDGGIIPVTAVKNARAILAELDKTKG